MHSVRHSILTLTLLTTGCQVADGRTPGGDDDAESACVDEDGDGYGDGAGCAGTDCDDGDPSVWADTDCEAVCDGDTHGTGCPCDPGAATEPEACYSGPPDTVSVGACRPGLRRCDDGEWTECDGQVLPADGDACGDGIDDDCDGEVDDGCDEDRCDGATPCDVDDIPREGGWNPENESGLAEREDGALVLDGSVNTTGYAWIANTDDATISKIDTTERREVARYPAVREVAPGVPPLDEPCDYPRSFDTGNCPSRSAVAPNGDAFVANRAPGNQGTVTRYAADLARCVDRDGDGIETSMDLDGDGAISTNRGDGEYLGLADECVLWTVPVGNENGAPKALAIAPALEPGATGEVFVGLNNERRVVVLDPEDGSVLDDLAVDVNPYGAAVSPDGRIWFAQAGIPHAFDGSIQAIDAVSHDVEAVVETSGVDCRGGYGIAVDEDGRVWRGSHPCRGVFRYDPALETWTRFDLEGTGNSLGVSPDGAGRMWVGFFLDGAGAPAETLLRIDGDTGEIELRFDIDDLLDDARGVGLDEEGQVWVVGRGTNNVIEVDPDSGDVVSLPVGQEPYTYSDFTGFGLNRIARPTGRYDHVFEGCVDGPTAWYDLEVDAELPAGTRIDVELRGAESLADLVLAPWRGPFAPPVDMRGERSRYLEVRIWLSREGGGPSPALRGFSLAHSCGGGIG